MTTVYVNGEARDVPPGASVADLVASLGLARFRLAVEVERALVPREAHAARALAEGERVEIVTFVGGG